MFYMRMEIGADAAAQTQVTDFGGRDLGIGGTAGRSRPPAEAGRGVLLNTRVVASGGQGDGVVRGCDDFGKHRAGIEHFGIAAHACTYCVVCSLSCGGSSECARPMPRAQCPECRSANIRGAVRDVPPSGGCPTRTAYAACPSMLHLWFFIKNA